MSLYHKITSGWNQPNKVAIIFEEKHITFGEIQQRTDRISLFLEQKDCIKGDIIGVQLSKSPLFLEIILAALQMGVAIVPLNDSYTEEEVMFYALDAEIKILISDRKYSDLKWISTLEIEGFINKQHIEIQQNKKLINGKYHSISENGSLNLINQGVVKNFLNGDIVNIY